MQNLQTNNLHSNILSKKNRTMALFSLLIVAFFALSWAAQPAEYVLLKNIPIQGKTLTTDLLNNAYVVTQQNMVERYDTAGNLTGRFGEQKYGSLHSVDATSPFNLLLFYKNSSTFVTVDGKMNPKNYYKLSSLGISNVSAACLSEDNYIWFFDQNDSKLKKINNEYEIVRESVHLNQMLGFDVNPNFMIERDGIIYLNDPDIGVLLFDRFGTYYNSFFYSGLNNFQVVNQRLVYPQGNELCVYNFKASDLQKVPLPQVGNMRSVQLQGDRLYILTQSSLEVYGKE